MCSFNLMHFIHIIRNTTFNYQNNVNLTTNCHSLTPNYSVDVKTVDISDLIHFILSNQPQHASTSS